jgi:hypothetical protein
MVITNQEPFTHLGFVIFERGTMDEDNYRRAVSLFNAGKKKEAEKILLDLVTHDPSSIKGWYGLTLCSDDINKKKMYFNKILDLDPKNQKATEFFEKYPPDLPPQNPQNQFTQLEPVQQTAYEETNRRSNLGIIILAIFVFVLFICIGWLIFKVDKLEKSLIQTQNELSTTKSSLARAWNDLSVLKNSLSSTISTLSYVQGIAENANNYAHSHTYSDIRLKTDIKPIDDPLNRLLLLNGVEFKWNIKTHPDFGFSDTPQIGLIAQDVERIFPEVVSSDKKGYKTVDYEKMVPIIIEAIKQQQFILENIQKEISN